VDFQNSVVSGVLLRTNVSNFKTMVKCPAELSMIKHYCRRRFRGKYPPNAILEGQDRTSSNTLNV